jgi:hypothetical protein
VGVNASDFIVRTKEMFKKCENAGIDKRNTSLYYIYANFNKHILNNRDIYEDYIKKMKQISLLNNRLVNSYTDQMKTEFDTAGFIIVKGNFKEFGKIIFVNRKLAQSLGYK